MADHHQDPTVPPAADEVVAAEPVEAVLEPEALVLSLQRLQERIPEFQQLSIEEKRAMARAAYLDPAFVAAAVHVAGLWDQTPMVIHRSAEAMRKDDEEARRWDDAIRSFSAVLEGLSATNLTRKHRVGQDALRIYRILGSMLRHARPEDSHLRPYYEEMKRVYRQNLPKKKPRKKGSKGEAAE